jgi:hypothetical protein
VSIEIEGSRERVADVASTLPALLSTTFILCEGVTRLRGRLSDKRELYDEVTRRIRSAKGPDMGLIGLSATEIGRMFSASASEVNRLLKEQGFLYGDAGAYGLTAKGEEFGRQLHHHRGPGGSAQYNRDWSQTYFDPSITSALHIDPETLAKLRSDMASDRLVKSAARRASQIEADAAFHASQTAKAVVDAGRSIDPVKALIVGGGLAIVSLSVYSTIKGVRWAQEKRQSIAESRNRANSDGNPPTTEGFPDSDDSGKPVTVRP